MPWFLLLAFGVGVGVLGGMLGILLLYIGFAFILSPRGSVSQSALPAGIAAVVSGIIAFILRRPRPLKRPLDKPREDLDYHI